MANGMSSAARKLAVVNDARPAAPSGVPRAGEETGLERPVGCREAARFLGCHHKTVERGLRSGAIPVGHPFNNGRRRIWRVYLSELDAWLRSREATACRPGAR